MILEVSAMVVVVFTTGMIAGAAVGFALGYMTFKKEKRMEELMKATCYDCEHCDVTEPDNVVWCYKHSKEVGLDDPACSSYVED